VAMVVGKPKFDVFLKYAKVELAPPTPAEIPQIFSELNQLIKSARQGAWKNTTVKEAFLNTVVTLEVLCWFFVGEIIGKRNIVGYKV